MEYTPLTTSTEQLRLLEIQPGTGDDVHCRMGNFDLAKCPPYSAISYTWGPCDPQRDIKVNGSPMAVRENAYQLLRQLRGHGLTQPTVPLKSKTTRDSLPARHQGKRPRRFWIDAICINQADPREKKHQVPLMNSIYSQSTLTYLWLGKETPWTSEAMKSLRRLARLPKSWRPTVVKANDVLNWSLRQKKQSALNELKQNGYWHRTWIIQEILLSPEIDILQGAECVPWRAMEALQDGSRSSALNTLNSYLTPLRSRFPFEKSTGSAQAEHLVEARQMYQDFISENGRRFDKPLVFLFDISGESRCQEINDRFYALLGLLLPDSQGKQVEVDYQRPALPLYLDAFSALPFESRPDLSRYHLFSPLKSALGIANIWGGGPDVSENVIKDSTDWICDACVTIDRIKTLVDVEEGDSVENLGSDRASLFSECLKSATSLPTFEFTRGKSIVVSEAMRPDTATLAGVYLREEETADGTGQGHIETPMQSALRLYKGEQGSVGAVCSNSAVGDTVCYLKALHTIAVIRPLEGANEAYAVVGLGLADPNLMELVNSIIYDSRSQQCRAEAFFEKKLYYVLKEAQDHWPILPAVDVQDEHSAFLELKTLQGADCLLAMAQHFENVGLKMLQVKRNIIKEKLLPGRATNLTFVPAYRFRNPPMV